MHIILAELVAALMLIWLAVEAVYHENAFELLASAVVACCISARLVYFIVGLLTLSDSLFSSNFVQAWRLLPVL